MKMGSNYLAILGVTTVTTVMSCSPAKKEYASFELYPVRTGSLTEMEYTPLATKFYLWSPTAEEVRLMLYDAGEGGHAYETVKMEPTEDGTWTTSVDENLLGKFYAFNVKSGRFRSGCCIQAYGFRMSRKHRALPWVASSLESRNSQEVGVRSLRCGLRRVFEY